MGITPSPLCEGAGSLSAAGGPPPSMVHAQAWRMVDELSRRQYGIGLVICWILDTQKKPYNLNVFMCTCIHVWERVWEGTHVPPWGPSSGPHTGKESAFQPSPQSLQPHFQRFFPSIRTHTLSSGSTVETIGCLSQFTHLSLWQIPSFTLSSLLYQPHISGKMCWPKFLSHPVLQPLSPK